jgi:hypothetical protein
MSRIDDIFGSIAGRLVRRFGSDVVFVRNAQAVYDPATGVATATGARLDLRAIITPAKAEEFDGVSQATDIKIVPDPDVIGVDGIEIDDIFEYQQAGETQYAKVVTAKQYRGDRPVAFIVLGRPQ